MSDNEQQKDEAQPDVQQQQVTQQYTAQPDAQQQQVTQQYTAQPDVQQQQMTQQYTAQPVYNQQQYYGQQIYPNQQQYYGQQAYPNQQQYYGQQAYPNQQYYAQQAYPNQQQYFAQPKQPSKLVNGIKNVQSEFKGKVNKMGLSIYCLLGIIAAMLLIVAPFMNFASIHVNERVAVMQMVHLKIKVSDGLNLFELAKASGTLDRAIDKVGNGYIDKDDLVDELDDMEDEIEHEIENEIDTDVNDSSINEVLGTAHLIIKGQVALYVTPWILIVSGIGLLIFTVVNNKKLKLVFSVIPFVCFIWLMICSSEFFSIMGIGAWAILLGIILGIISALKDKQECNQ